MVSLKDMMNKMDNDISQGNMRTSLTTDEQETMTTCPLCGQEPLCRGLGVVRYEVPIDDPRFGKLFRCPNHPVEMDVERQEKLRKLSNLSAYTDKTFSNFQVDIKMLTPSQQESLAVAYSIALSFAQHPEGWLLLEGGYGCGKTHLAAAVGNARLQHGDMVLFLTTPDLLDHLRSTYGPSSEVGYDELFERVRNVPLLILDDLGTENPSQWAQEKLFQLLNHRYSRLLPTVVTTNVDLDTLDPRIRSRLLDEHLVHRAKITAPDYRTSVKHHDDLLANLRIYRDMTFEHFDTRKKLLPAERVNLERALEEAQKYAKAPQGWLVLIGAHGTGKTHLAAAIAHQVRRSRIEAVFVTVPDLLDYLRLTYAPNSPVSFDRRFQMIRNAPLLVLDDLGVESATPWAREKLYQILDHRYVTNLPTVITTPKAVEEFETRIVSRLTDERRCKIFAVTGPDFASRMNRK